jgi:hypothetical protein
MPGYAGEMHRVGQHLIYTVYIRCFWQGTHQIYGHIRRIPMYGSGQPYMQTLHPGYISTHPNGLAGRTRTVAIVTIRVGLARSIQYMNICVHSCIGLARTIYIRCIYGIFNREITKYTVIYGAYIRFWPTL